MAFEWTDTSSSLFPESAVHLQGRYDYEVVVHPDGSKEPLYPNQATVRWDGCVNYSNYANGYSWDHEHEGEDCMCAEQSIHICNIDRFIDELTALKDAARRYFVEQRGREKWPDI